MIRVATTHFSILALNPDWFCDEIEWPVVSSTASVELLYNAGAHVGFAASMTSMDAKRAPKLVVVQASNKVHCAHYYSDIIARFSKQERNYLNQNSPAPYLETGQMWMFRCCLGNNNTEDRQYWRDDDKLRYVSKTPIFALAP